MYSRTSTIMHLLSLGNWINGKKGINIEVIFYDNQEKDNGLKRSKRESVSKR